MEELRQMLQDKYGWLTSTTGAKHVSVKLDANQLARINKALRYLDACEQASAAMDLSKIELRMLA